MTTRDLRELDRREFLTKTAASVLVAGLAARVPAAFAQAAGKKVKPSASDVLLVIDVSRRVCAGLEELGVYWVEEPFPPDAVRDYSLLAGRTRIPIAAGENHFLRYQIREHGTTDPR